MTKEFDYSPIDKILENHEKTAGHSHIAGYSGDISLSSKGNIPISCKKAWHRRSKNIQRCDLL